MWKKKSVLCLLHENSLPNSSRSSRSSMKVFKNASNHKMVKGCNWITYRERYTSLHERNAESNKNSFSVIRFKQKIKTSKYSIDLCQGDILSCINPYFFSLNLFCDIAKELRKQSECMSKKQRNPLLSFAFVRVKMAGIRWCLFGERFLEMVR